MKYHGKMSSWNRMYWAKKVHFNFLVIGFPVIQVWWSFASGVQFCNFLSLDSLCYICKLCFARAAQDCTGQRTHFVLLFCYCDNMCQKTYWNTCDMMYLSFVLIKDCGADSGVDRVTWAGIGVCHKAEWQVGDWWARLQWLCGLHVERWRNPWSGMDCLLLLPQSICKLKRLLYFIPVSFEVTIDWDAALFARSDDRYLSKFKLHFWPSVQSRLYLSAIAELTLRRDAVICRVGLREKSLARSDTWTITEPRGSLMSQNTWRGLTRWWRRWRRTILANETGCVRSMREMTREGKPRFEIWSA